MSTMERFTRGAVVAFLLLALITLAFALGYGVQELRDDDDPSPAVGNGNPEADAASELIDAQLLDEIYRVLEENFVDRELLDPSTIRQAAIDGILATLNDPHTQYISPEDLEAGALDLGSTYDGIGASVTDQNGVVEIVAPFRGSPAEQAGIRAGDIILEVDGERTDGWTDQQAVQRIRGERGTTVSLTVQHTQFPEGDDQPAIETIDVVRGEIDIESVFTEPVLESIPGESGESLVDRDGAAVGDIAYVHISQFHDKTLGELQDALADVENGDYIGLIVDVRLNPGGLLSATVDVVDEFLESGVVLSEEDADGEVQSWGASEGGAATSIPIVVIMDGTSASGAEVLAAALRDNERATLVGTRTFGKGTVNQLRMLENCDNPAGCGALYVSVGRWLTPNGDLIEGVGVAPDVELAMTVDEYLESGDLQIFEAIDILRGGQ